MKMKTIKNLLILFAAVAFTYCEDNNIAPPYPLTYDNIAGTYNIQSLSIDTKTTTEVGGFPVTINANGVGNTFQVNLVMNQNQTYTITGEHVFVITASGPGFPATTETEIITIDETGTFVINSDNSITFSDQNAEFLNGTLNVIVFNESSFSLTQEAEEVIPVTNSTITANLAVSFVRP